jgi:hypothetical protein
MPFFSLKRAKNVMAYRSYLRSVLNDNFKILTWVLILFIAIIPNFIFMQSANAAVGGWTMSNPIAQGASTVYTGIKNITLNGADYVKKGTAIVTPTATGVAKVLAKGVAGVALSVAVEQLLGAVDWVLDPANNQIVYTPDASPTQPNPNIPKFWLIQDKYINPNQIGFSSVAAACTFIIGKKVWSTSPVVSSVVAADSSCNFYNNIGSLFGSVGLAYVSNPAYDPAKPDEKKTLPLETVAQKVISNAASGDAAAQVATTAAAADIVSEAEKDNVKARPIAQQLEASSSTKPADEAAAAEANTATGTQTQNPTKPETTDLKLEFPVFCNWAPIVCEAAQTAVNFMTDFEPDAESGEVTIHQDSNIIFDDSQRVNFSSSCPSPEQFSVSFFGASQNLEFSYQPLCDFMSMIKPFVIAGSYLIGAYIVMGLSRGSAD